jgi:hypothetical protein
MRSPLSRNCVPAACWFFLRLFGHVPPPEALGAVLTPQSAAELLRTAPRAFAVHVGPTISWRPLSGLRQAADVISQLVEASPGPEAPTTRTTASLSVSSTSPTVDSPPADGLPVLPLEWTWVDVEASSPEDIVLLGRWIALPILTPKDLTQSVEKAEALARRGAVLCMVRSGPSTPTAPLPLHVVSLRNVVLTVHVGKHPAHRGRRTKSRLCLSPPPLTMAVPPHTQCFNKCQTPLVMMIILLIVIFKSSSFIVTILGAFNLHTFIYNNNI